MRWVLPWALLLAACTGGSSPADPAPPLRRDDAPAADAASRRAPTAADAWRATFVPTGDELYAHVARLADPALRGRAAGSSDERRAADYLAEQLRAAGATPAAPGGGWLQRFPIRAADGVDRESVNVLAWIRGSGGLPGHILIAAHIDHLGVGSDGAIYVGADDDASGVAALIGVARAWQAGPFAPRRDILLAGFGAEELHMLGSTHYAEHPVAPVPEMAAMINLDMVSRPRFYDYASMGWAKKLAGIADGPGVGLLSGRSALLLAFGRCAAAAEQLPAYAPEDFPRLRDMIAQQTAGRGDFAPFDARGVPYLFFSTSEHDDYHEPTDTLDKVDRDVMRRITAAAWRTTLAIDAADRLDGDAAAPPCAP